MHPVQDIKRKVVQLNIRRSATCNSKTKNPYTLNLWIKLWISKVYTIRFQNYEFPRFTPSGFKIIYIKGLHHQVSKLWISKVYTTRFQSYEYQRFTLTGFKVMNIKGLHQVSKLWISKVNTIKFQSYEYQRFTPSGFKIMKVNGLHHQVAKLWILKVNTIRFQSHKDHKLKVWSKKSGFFVKWPILRERGTPARRCPLWWMFSKLIFIDFEKV